MSRWSRKPQAEKETTKQNAEKNEKEFRPKYVLEQEKQNDEKMNIYKNGEIPMRCECGITSCENYTLVMMRNQIFGVQQTAIGNCKKCGKRVQQVIAPQAIGFDASVMVTQAIMLLNVKGRLTDERMERVREFGD